jgi:phosphoribosylanthranilate isomerase
MTIPEPVAALFARGQVIKVCGIREPGLGAAAAEAGADIIGFIFAPARRQVTAETARACLAAAREVKPDILACGVFVNAPVSEISEVTRVAGLDLIQLLGDDSIASAQSLPLPATRVIRPEPGMSPVETLERMKTYQSASVPPVAVLLDAYSASAAGGTGETLDWNLAAEVNAEAPIVLAGGLDPENVARAIGQVRPIGVDASTGMEREGRKSADLIHAFVEAARAGFNADSLATRR